MENYAFNRLFNTLIALGYDVPLFPGTLACTCLSDLRRTQALHNIISRTVAAERIKQGGNELVVADLGAGSGILGFSALEAGARGAIFVEQNYACTLVMKHAATELGYRQEAGGNRFVHDSGQWIEIIYGDATTCNPRRQDIGLVIAEMIGTGLLSEPQVDAIRNIKPYCRPDAKYIPEQAESTVTLFGKKEPNDRGEEMFAITEPTRYDVLNFSDGNLRHGVDTTCGGRVFREGWVTRIGIRTDLHYPTKDTTSSFDALCQPRFNQIMPEVHVTPGDLFRISLAYTYGEQASNREIKLVIACKV